MGNPTRSARLHAAIRETFEAHKGEVERICGVAVSLAHADGAWTIMAADDTPIARFDLALFPHCGAIAILYGLEIEPPYRMGGLARLIQDVRAHAAQQAGIRALLATVVTANQPAMRLFKGWRELCRFVNETTGNEVALVIKTLERDTRQ